MITSHKPPRSELGLALRLAVIIVLVAVTMLLLQAGVVGIDEAGNVRFFEWGYCLLESWGCSPG